MRKGSWAGQAVGAKDGNDHAEQCSGHGDADTHEHGPCDHTSVQDLSVGIERDVTRNEDESAGLGDGALRRSGCSWSRAGITC